MNKNNLGQQEQDWNPWRENKGKIEMLMLKAGLDSTKLSRVRDFIVGYLSPPVC